MSRFSLRVCNAAHRLRGTGYVPAPGAAVQGDAGGKGNKLNRENTGLLMIRGLRTGFLFSMAVGVAAMAVQPVTAQPPPGYYNSAEGLTGQPLRTALHQ